MAQELQEKQRWPKVSCLMVTADRPHLVRRAIRSYLQQTYPNRELVVLDNGRHPLDEALLAEVPADELVYARVEPRPDLVIGTLRNQALELARGDYIAPQWDDDDWSHPERLMRQMQVLLSGDYDACTLAGTLMHVNHPAYFFYPFIGLLRHGVPPTIVHRRNATIRYPDLRRTSDTHYVEAWRRTGRYVILPPSESHLYLRYFHGGNLWEQEHFLRRMRNTPRDFLAYLWYRYVRGNEFAHPRFRLTPAMQEAFERYLQDSIETGVFDPERLQALHR